MNFKVIEFGVLSHSVWPLSLLTPVATKYRVTTIKQPTEHFFPICGSCHMVHLSESPILSANGSCYLPMMVGAYGPPNSTMYDYCILP